MKINYFSPLPPIKSGISEVAALIIPILAQYAEVTVWTNQGTWSKDLENCANIRSYRKGEINWREMNKVDFTIYHIGNNVNYHHDISVFSQQLPGMVVLHDVVLFHLFTGFYKEIDVEDQSLTLDTMEYHSSEMTIKANQFWAKKAINTTLDDFTPTKWAIHNAAAVLVHTRGAFANLSEHQQWVLGYQPLPCNISPSPPKKLVTTAPPYHLIIFGHIGCNRRVGSVFQALEESPNKALFQLHIYGSVEDNEELLRQIKQRNLKLNVTLHGFVTDKTLDLALSSAHLAINLRYPTMGEASLSQLRIWRHALPSIVTRVGWYAEQSEDAVLFVDQEHEVEDIKRHLQSLVDAPESLIAMGKRGQQILQADHSPDAYARALIELAKELPIGYQALTSQYFVKRVGKEMAHWQMPELGNQELSGVAAAIHFLTQ